jgi:hypothetical protein
MKKSLLLFAFIISFLHAQSQCTVDFSQTSPGLYPDSLPTAFVGQSYSEDITFVMPLDTMGYLFTNFNILSISLPVGLNWVCNSSANGCNYNPQVNQYGCVNVYGTPLLAGQYNIDVTVIADLNIVQGVPVTFQVYMEVLPSNTSVTNTGFSMLGSTGCLPITVNFTNNNPGLLAYEWDFGNGNTSSLENPSPQIYNTIGNHVVSYKAWDNLTTTDVYTLTSVTINTIQNVFSWGYPTELNPDPYFKIKENGIVIYNSNYVADTPPPLSWTVNIVMNSANTYVIEVWDEDDYELFYGGDDLVGTHTMNINGCSGCAAGTDAIVSYTINHVVIPPVPLVVSVDTVRVFGYPGVPNIVYDSLAHELSTDTLNYFLQWYYNESPISGSTLDTFNVQLSGDYYVIAVNTDGCVAFSDTITAIFCSGLAATINVNGNVFSTPDTTGNTFQWYDANGPISGANQSFYVVTTAGDYHVEVTDEFGCNYISNTLNSTLSIDEDMVSTLEYFPNPANEFITVRWSENQPMNKLRLVDITGKEILSFSNLHHQQTIQLKDISKGIYFIECIFGEKITTEKIIVE